MYNLGMSILRLCYGIHCDIDTWRDAIDVPKSDGQSKICGFCSKKNPLINNFCGNCGVDIRGVEADLSPAEIVDITIRQLMPPVPLQILADSSNVYICQILGEDVKGVMVDFNRPIKTFQWEKIKAMVEEYAMKIGLPGYQTRIFTFVETKGEKKCIST